MSLTETKKVVFDVINSVKGGAGKSTFSLLLASYYSTQKNAAAYIIDLDLRGTSWVVNNVLYMKRQDGEPVVKTWNYKKANLIYINDLMNDFGAYKDRGFFVRLTTQYDTSAAGATAPMKPGTFSLCVGKPTVDEDIDDLKTDLFENAVFHVIDQIYTRHCQSSDEIEEIHIILDMPPSYERHAERILRRLLLDVESQLYRNVKGANSEGKYGFISPYIVNLYMISAVSPAHIDLNIEYVKNLFNKQVYSSALNEMASDGRFCVRFIGNDIADVIGDFELSDYGKQVSDAVANYIHEGFTHSEFSRDDFSMYGEKFVDALSSFPMLSHMSFPYHEELIINPRATKVGNVLPVPNQGYADIKEVIKKSLK